MNSHLLGSRMSPDRVVLDGESARMPSSADPRVETIHHVAELSERPCRKMGPVGIFSLQRLGQKSMEHTIIERKYIRTTEVDHLSVRCLEDYGLGGSEFIRGRGSSTARIIWFIYRYPCKLRTHSLSG